MGTEVEHMDQVRKYKAYHMLAEPGWKETPLPSSPCLWLGHESAASQHLMPLGKFAFDYSSQVQHSMGRLSGRKQTDGWSQLVRQRLKWSVFLPSLRPYLTLHPVPAVFI